MDIYPYIEEWETEPKIKVIARLEPEKITKELIHDHVIVFLNDLIEFADTDTVSQTQFGFLQQSLE